ncbi:MAG: hypothetical protein WC677_08365 [Clostridia bacterium]|jgi:UTP-glucose-1-phosphate uridylyltransferase
MEQWLKEQINNSEFHVSNSKTKNFDCGYYAGLQQAYENCLAKKDSEKENQLAQLDKIFPNKFGLHLRIYNIFV